MARTAAVSPENSFIKGLITEATGLNFPENACTETFDCVFDQTGQVSRRLGFDYEASYTTASITRNDSAIIEYVWDSVAGNGNKQLVVVQIGNILNFYDVGNTTNLSTRKKSFTVSLDTYKTSGATTTAASPCQFATGSGRLFVVNEFMTPIYVTWNSDDTITVSTIDIKIRDFAGMVETTEVDFRPTTQTAAHKYNLFNQGWYPDGIESTGFASTDQNPVWMWDAGRSDFPSNADVWWAFKNSSEQFDAGFIKKINLGSTPAPKGHFVLDAFDQKRGLVDITSITTGGVVTTRVPHAFIVGQSVTIFGSTANNSTYTISAVGSDSQFTIATTTASTGGRAWSSTLTYTNSGNYRPSVISFFAGRIFYGGVNTSGYNNNIYFSRVIESEQDYGFCMQVNDPTAEDNSDLYPTDGGVIVVPEMGNLIRMMPVGSDLILFASNGIWQLSGSKGLSFAANDYAVRKLSSVPAISGTSFVVVEGFPMFWNNDGIYIARANQVGDLQVDSLTNTTIATFYSAIPTNSKYYAKGVYDANEKVVSWLYRSTQTTDIDDQYTYDRVLNFNILTTAFYPWTIQQDQLAPNVNGSVVIQYAGVYTPSLKYLTTTPVSGFSYNASWSETRNTSYRDWVTPGRNLNYVSYATTGYKVHSQGVTNYQKNYVVVYCKRDANSSLNLRGRWDFANNSASGIWSTSQEVYVDTQYREFVMRRIKIRGQGKSCQLAFSSTNGKPFFLIGWAAVESANQGP